ncbi:MAG: extracellular solute-binding protein, partial [Clostridia bacterium]|nr:extracellular solute-binding protein [Clostridia bacterium]
YEYRLRDGKPYGVPWQDAYAPGFIYNKKMFRDNGWELPETMDEFFALCDKIAATGVAPLVFGGGQQNGYITNFFTQWLVGYYGYDYMNNTFQKYESPDIYDFTKDGRLKVYQTAAKMLQGTAPNGTPYALAGSKSLTAQAAQREFIQGHAAMDICGNWFPTEMTAFLKGYPDFEYGYMPLPHINADKKDYRGNDSSSVRYSLDGNILCVPASSKHKDIAKDFLVSMYTKESYQTFVEENNGVLRPANIEIDGSKLNDFAKASYDYFYAGKAADQFIYECSLSPMSLNGYLALFISQNGNTPGNLINAANYEAAMAVAATAAADDYPRALEMWDSANKKWKDSYLGAQ